MKDMKLVKKNYIKSITDKINNDDIMETFDIIGRKRGALLRGNIVDYDKVYSLILRDIKDENIKGITFDRFN